MALMMLFIPPLWLILSLFLQHGTARALSSPAAVAKAAEAVSSTAKHTLFDMPVSNNGARCRIILYKKNIPDTEVAIVPPTTFDGGLKNPDYLKINPQGKMPSLVCRDTDLCLAESDTIARYLIDTYAVYLPSFDLANPRSNLICRLHDMYLTTIQSCLYKPSGPFGVFGTRQDALREFVQQLQNIDKLLVPNAPYCCGDHVTLADATLFPTCVFASTMLPKFAATATTDQQPPLPPNISRWYERLKANDAAFAKVHDEIANVHAMWEERDRWEKILGGGWRDTAPATIFDKILTKEIPAEIVYEDDKVLAFRDINPAAPAHVLVIPKNRAGLTRLRHAQPGEHVEILGRLLTAAAQVSRDEALFANGARIVINDGPDGGQEVDHLHVHVLGGRKMEWPPG